MNEPDGLPTLPSTDCEDCCEVPVDLWRSPSCCVVWLEVVLIVLAAALQADLVLVEQNSRAAIDRCTTTCASEQLSRCGKNKYATGEADLAS